MWGAVCGKTARTALGGVCFECYFERGINLLMNSDNRLSSIAQNTIIARLEEVGADSLCPRCGNIL